MDPVSATRIEISPSQDASETHGRAAPTMPPRWILGDANTAKGQIKAIAREDGYKEKNYLKPEYIDDYLTRAGDSIGHAHRIAACLHIENDLMLPRRDQFVVMVRAIHDHFKSYGSPGPDELDRRDALLVIRGELGILETNAARGRQWDIEEVPHFKAVKEQLSSLSA